MCKRRAPAPPSPPPPPPDGLSAFRGPPLPSGRLPLHTSWSDKTTYWPVFRDRTRAFVRITPAFICLLSTEESKAVPSNRLESWKTLDAHDKGIPHLLGPVRTSLHHIAPYRPFLPLLRLTASCRRPSLLQGAYTDPPIIWLKSPLARDAALVCLDCLRLLLFCPWRQRTFKCHDRSKLASEITRILSAPFNPSYGAAATDAIFADAEADAAPTPAERSIVSACAARACATNASSDADADVEAKTVPPCADAKIPGVRVGRGTSGPTRAGSRTVDGSARVGLACPSGMSSSAAARHGSMQHRSVWTWGVRGDKGSVTSVVGAEDATSGGYVGITYYM